jgi:pyruvate/2-oxoglutarate dehydrogenase complex dihydrolipoamide acyltransferase (E2) component
METKQVFKLTNQALQTHNNFQWTLNRWCEAPGTGELCTNGWLHWYHSPELALFLNPIHANIDNPRLFVAEASGAMRDDNGLKGGSTKLRIVQEIQYVAPTTEQRVKFTILCASAVYRDKSFIKWANGWLDGSDRSCGAADKAYWAAAAAARAAAAAAAARAAAAYAAADAAAADAAVARAARAAYYAAKAGINLDLAAIAKLAME